MDTNELIKALAADSRPSAISLPTVWYGAAAMATLLAAAVFAVMLGPRPDFWSAADTPRFVFKFIATITLAVGAFRAVRALSRPEGNWRKAFPYLGAAPALLAIAVVFELLVVPPEAWLSRAIGKNSMVCLTYIPLIGIGPLLVLLMALRHGAPTRPRTAGAAVGLLAGAIAATFYAAQCTDDSPLFVAVWYTIAVVGFAALGSATADRLARW